MSKTASGCAVLFDLDGTLVDSEPIHHQALLDVLEAGDITLHPDIADRTTGLSIQAVYDLLVANHDDFAIDYPAFVSRKYTAYLTRKRDLAPRPGAREALRVVTERDAMIAIVSNSDRVLVTTNLEAIGLTWPGLVTVSRNDVRRAKPDPEPYLRAAWLLGVPATRCIVVEDSPIGATAGLSAGMMVIGWPEPHLQSIEFPAGTIAAAPHDLASCITNCLIELQPAEPHIGYPVNVS